MAYSTSDFLQDRWPVLPYVAPDGTLELTTAFSARAIPKFCDLLSGTLSASDQVSVLNQCASRISTPEDCEGVDAQRLGNLSLKYLERGMTVEVRLDAANLLG